MLTLLKKYIGQKSVIRLTWHHSKSLIAAVWYGFPARKLQIIGITGTDGKTTTVGMVAHILRMQGCSVGALSTAFFRINDTITWNTTEKTSPSPFVIQKFLRTLVKNKCTHAVLEVSSHGLVQGRVNYTWPYIAAITNTDAEHLDYHGTLDQYRKDKALLFKKLRKSGTAVLNVTDESFRYCFNKDRTTVTYSLDSQKPAAITLQAVTVTEVGTIASFIIDSKQEQLELTIPGVFNVYNALCAIAISTIIHIDPSTAAQALQSFKNAPGRLEQVHAGQNFLVYIDFTVTPQAFRATLQTLNEQLEDGKKLHVLTGSCGDRMKEKRPEIGAICASMADSLIITDDEPYTESPAAIRADIRKGIPANTKCNVQEIADRTEAMTAIFLLAHAGDIVLLAGLGSYPSRMFAEGQRPWNEKEIAQKLLQTHAQI